MSYSWGEDDRVSTPISRGFDYASARKAYADPTPRAEVYAASASAFSGTPLDHMGYKCDVKPPVDKTVETDSTHPIVIATDITGSMSTWPKIIFEKLPLLGKEVERYAPGYAISFAAFGDSRCDRAPLQVRDFEKGESLDAHIAALYPEGGGGDEPESHNIVAHYYNERCKIDKAVKPIFLLITDTYSHDTLSKGEISRYIGGDAQATTSNEIFEKLSKKFSVYVLLKGIASFTYWSDIFGKQKVKVIEQPRDIVELIIGVIAGEVDALKDFEARSSKRHEDMPDRVERVMKSLKADEVGKPLSPEDAGKAKSSKDKSARSMKSRKLV